MARYILAMLLCMVTSLCWGKASLQGSHASMERQVEEAERNHLSFLEDDEDLAWMIKKGYIIKVPERVYLTIDSRLESKWRYARPWTVEFLLDLARDFYRTFGRPLQLNSAVRTIERQEEIRKGKNGNAADLRGPRRSVHPTGAAIDLGKFVHTEAELEWLRKRLLKLEADGLIEATEEYKQAVFHIMVFKKYGHRERGNRRH